MKRYVVEVYDKHTVWRNEAGQFHREEGPAVESSCGYNKWYINGKLHRLDGPAIEYGNGCFSWYIEGVEYTEKEFNAKINPVKELTVAEISKLLGYEIKIIK